MEKNIERYLRRRVEAAGGECWKWVSPGRTGVPDRIVIFPGGVIAFAETKDCGKKERPVQRAVQNRLRQLGARVWSGIDSREKADRMIKELTAPDSRQDTGAGV